MITKPDRVPDDGGLLRRVAMTDRATVHFVLDGKARTALAGDTLLVAILAGGSRLRESEFGDGARAGFCLMGACQDCWVVTSSGERLRACTTPVREGLSIITGSTAWNGR